jgi:lactoylglutathione lyase
MVARARVRRLGVTDPRLADVRLLAEDFDRCLAFYRDAVGLDVRLHVEGVYAELDGGGTGVTLAVYRRDLMAEALGSTLAPPVGERIVFTFDVDDVDATFTLLVRAGATPVKEPHDQPAWEIRVAHLRDPEGNLFELDQRRG